MISFSACTVDSYYPRYWGALACEQTFGVSAMDSIGCGGGGGWWRWRRSGHPSDIYIKGEYTIKQIRFQRQLGWGVQIRSWPRAFIQMKQWTLDSHQAVDIGHSSDEVDTYTPEASDQNIYREADGSRYSVRRDNRSGRIPCVRKQFLSLSSFDFTCEQKGSWEIAEWKLSKQKPCPRKVCLSVRNKCEDNLLQAQL